MTLRPVYGHGSLLNRLERAIASGRFPQSALLVGEPGVGKQRLALWIARRLLCDRPGDGACGGCEACRFVDNLAHPDLHWFVPITRPKAGDVAKQLDEARDLLGEARGERRGGLTPPLEGMASHPLASIRLMLRIVAMKPFHGARKVVILGDADRLVVQEASQEAANALLKVLEEPPSDTTFLLTAAEPQGLLPTIRSRVVPIRVGRVGDEDVAAFVERETDRTLTGADRERLLDAAAGSIGRGLWQGKGGDAATQAAERFLAAVRAGPGRWTEAALKQTPWSARGDFSAMLDALAVTLLHEVRSEAAGSEAERLRRRVKAMRRVEETRADATANLNPQLALAVLAHDLEALT